MKLSELPKNQLTLEQKALSLYDGLLLPGRRTE